MKVAFFSAKPYEIEYFSRVNKRFNHQINYFKDNLNKGTVGLASGHQAICAFVNDTLDKEVIKQLSKLQIKIIALRSAGYNHIDLKACELENITVCYVPKYSPHSVAEHTFALLLTLNRKTHKAYQRVRENNFSLEHLMGMDLHGKSIGLIGLGKIGLCVAKIANGFGLNVFALDPAINQKTASQHSVTLLDETELFKKSDIISLHCPLNNATKYIINEQSFNSMKQGVILLNTGRGALINHKDLISALKSKKIGYVGLDVYEQEKNVFFYNHSEDIIDDDILMRLISFPNVLITSHQGFFTQEALTNIAKTTLLNLNNIAQNKPTNLINLIE